jgi:hypothetical protein
LIDEKTGLICGQTPDHYYSCAGICGWLLSQGIDAKVNDKEDMDIVATFSNGKTLALDYQTSLPDNNREPKIMGKWQRGTADYDYFYFVSDSVGVKEIRSIMKSDVNILPRGTQLEAKLLELIAENK